MLSLPDISLAKRSSGRSPGNEVCTLCQKYGTDSGYYNKGNVIRCNTYQYTNWHELGVYPHL